MVKASNFIIKGKGFYKSELNKKQLSKVKKSINSYLTKKYYSTGNIIDDISEDFFLCKTYYYTSKEDIPLNLKIRKSFGMIGETEYNFLIHANWLRGKLNDLPYEIDTIISYGEYEGHKGISVEIISKPLILFKMKQLNYKYVPDDFSYSVIINSNVDFVYKLLKALGVVIIDSPSVMKDLSEEIYSTPLIKQLKGYGYKKCAKVLEIGLNKLKSGDVRESLDELRSVLEIFTMRICNRISKKKLPQSNVKGHINIIKEKGFIDGGMSGIIISVYTNKLYPYISDIIHKRKEISISDAEFIYGLIESYIEYLIKKVIL
ncbi:MAG: hypothetical protein ACTSW3_11395 [Promethearchaeota archaeon]